MSTAAMSETASGTTAVALLLGAAALLMVPTSPRWGAHHRTAPGVRGANSPAAAISAPRRNGLVGAAAVCGAGFVLAPALWWIVVPAAALTGVVLARMPAGRSAAARAEDRRLIAVHAELLASCLDAGMAVGPSLRAVSDVLSDSGPPTSRPPPDDAGPLAVLDAVAAMLSLGADPSAAWRIAELDEDLAPLAAAACRSAAGGGGLAQAVREHAAQLRQEIAASSVRAAGRAGVMMTAPLGVCFLPAFLCLGLAPVVVGLLGQLDIF